MTDIRARANTLLQALCEYRGVETVTLADEVKVDMDIDGRLFVFAYSEETEELLSLAYIAPLPQNARKGELLRELLRGSYAWAGTDGGILGLDQENGWVCLSRRYRPERLEPGEFLAKTANQAGLVDYWRKALDVVPPESEPVPDHAVRV
jgi:hypothetical protein